MGYPVLTHAHIGTYLPNNIFAYLYKNSNTNLYDYVYFILFRAIQVCKASNQFGDQTVSIRVHVNSYLSVHIHPQVQIINSGGTAIFNCSITGTSVQNIEWFHDGIMIMTEGNHQKDNK